MNRFRWPDGKQCAVVLSFDFDGECTPLIDDPSGARNRLTLQSEAEFGITVGMDRIARLLRSYNLRSTVFVPGFTAERHPTMLQDLARQGHEIGHHGYLHERPDSLSDAEEEHILQRGIDVLREITGARPRGYRSPSWELKPTTPALLKRYGFSYDSSLMGNDVPYLVATDTDPLLELPVSWLLDDWPHFAFGAGQSRAIAEPSRVLEMWSWEFEGMYRENGCFVLTMHPHVSGRASRIMVLERLIRYIAGFPDVWWATCGDVADYCMSTPVCTLQPYLDLGQAASPQGGQQE